MLLLVGAVALPLTLLAGLGVWQAHEQAWARAESEALGQARLLAAAVDREFDRLEVGLRALANSTALAEGRLDGVEAEMRALSSQLDGTPIGLVKAGGPQLVSTVWPPGERRPEATIPPAVVGSLASGRAEISDLITSHNTGRQVIAVVMPVPPPAPDGRPGPVPPTHAFAAALPPGWLATALRRPAGAEAEAPIVTVIDRTGRIVARSRGEAELLGRAVRPAFLDRLHGAAEGIFTNAATYEGESARFAFARAPRSGFTVALALAEADLQAPLQEALGRVGLLAAGILAAGAALAAWLAARIARMLRRLGAADASRPLLREVDELAGAIAARDRAIQRLAESERRFRALGAAGALVLWRGDAGGGILEAEGWETLTGQPDTALRGDGWLTMLHPADRNSTVAVWGAARSAGSPVDVEYRVRTRAGDWHWVRARGVPVGDGDALEWVGVVEDVHERRLAALALAERQERLRLAVEAARLNTWEYEPPSDRGTRAARVEEALVAPEGSGFRLADWIASVHPEDRAAAEEQLRSLIEGRSAAFRAEFRVRRRPPAEGWAWIATYGAAVERDPATGQALRLAGVSQDVTERREAEQRRTLLMREVDHRAKNVLAVVQSVLRLTRRDDPARFATAVEARVAALARAHTLLAEAGWAGAELRELAGRELAGCPARMEGPRLTIAAAAVQPLAMVLHELAANAAKHGAATRPEGRIALTWRLEGDRLLLAWTEQGGPPVQAPARQGFGSRMIEAIVRNQLGGTLEMRWLAAGLDCRISLPAARVVAGEEASPVPAATP
ncbi:PAS domain-containing protein [Belnapia sp. T6]|uniref:histidine kinase n=2 Tax=Belnapia mucosa TaxID=2804532 RepID=A0ABS1UWT3_9PROT|nr:PAS domain-containing protein [Belnapia mucosa]